MDGEGEGRADLGIWVNSRGGQSPHRRSAYGGRTWVLCGGGGGGEGGAGKDGDGAGGGG
jgi:hypothetical protein